MVSSLIESHTAVSHPLGVIDIRGRRVVDFTCWDYFGLANHVRVKRAAQSGIESSGITEASPRLSSGTRDEHTRVEFRIAKFFGTQSALLSQSRNQAILSFFSSVLNEHDALFVDESSQSVVNDAAYLMQTPTFNFHSDEPDSLSAEFEKAKFARRKFVFVETLSAYSGMLCPLERLVEACVRAGAILVLDESNAVGAIGLRGAGLSEQLPSREALMAIICDLSRGIGSYGGAIACSRECRDLILSRSRYLATECGPPAFLAAATEAALDVVELAPIDRESIAARATRLRTGLSQEHQGGSPIVSVAFEKISAAIEFASGLFQKGFYCDVVPRGTYLSEAASVRFIIRTVHSATVVEEVLQAVSDIKARI